MGLKGLGRAKRYRGAAVRAFLLVGTTGLLSLGYLHCGATTQLGQAEPKDICNCLAVAPDISDYRHAAKHVPLPNVTPQEITVTDILGWDQGLPVLPPDAPRSGRELQLFHVANAYLQNASVNTSDCDVHLEISQTADRNAPR
ncbi:MAG: hypothetical protein ACRD3E_20270, partial [Terriglobales bacterium]